MKANELRIGAMFDYNGDIYCAGIIYTDLVKGMHINGFGYGQFPIDDIKPIPLTEEWLLRLGFELVDAETDYMSWDFQGFKIGNDGGLDEYNIKPFFEIENRVYLKSVHQLQNLYFALTNEELKIVTNE